MLCKISRVIGSKTNYVILLLSMHGQLLKDQPKWLDQLKESSSKRAKSFANGDYSSSSNLKALIKVLESDTLSRIPRPMGQKAAKRKIKGKWGATSTSIVDLLDMEAAIREKTIVTQKLAEAKEIENVAVLYEILMKDTSTLSEK